LLKKLPKKLGDPGKFLIPCDFPELEECLAIVDLGASINLMPFSVWKKLSLPKLTPTRMNLELANRSVAYPVGVAEDVFVKVGKFYFPADFVVVNYDVDPRVPLILGRPFLRMTRALINVHGEELTLRVNDKAITFKVRHTSIYSRNYYDELVNQINVTDVACKEYAQEVLSPSGSGSLPSNTVANSIGDLKAITTQSGVAYEGPSIPPTSLPKEVEQEPEVTKDKVQTTVNTTTSSPSLSPNVTALTEIVKELLLMNKAIQQATVKAIEETCVTCVGPHPYYECLATGGNTFDTYAAVRPYNQGGNG
nr:reverse transcriptase domain-containing protein [Tanacetum cinerariifolium]